MARLRRPGEAGDPRARRQERQHRLRRRRHRGRGRQRAVRRLRQRRPGLLRALPDPGRALGVRRVPVARSSPPSPGCGCSTRATSRSEMGPLISAQQKATVHRLPRRGGRWRSRARRRAATASGCRRRVVTTEDADGPDLARGGLRPGRRGDAVRRRGARRRAGQRHASTACPARSSPATSAAGCGSRGRSRPATSASTRTRRCATGRRSAATSSPASAGSSVRTPPTAFTEEKNVFIAH